MYRAALLLLLTAPLEAATINVNAGESVQAAITKAQPGDEILLQAGARFVGGLKLPARPFGLPITIRSSATLPERRISESDAPLLPVLAAVGEAVISGVNTASWRLIGLRLEQTTFGEIISLQGVNSIEMDRLLITVTGQQKRAIGGNGKAVKLTRSYISGVWSTGQDSQAFAAWDGAGPYTIVDNYLEAASENILFGGADSATAESMPRDILVEYNTLSKPLSWKGQPRNVKNLLELKAAERVVIRNNVLENNWADGQSGTAVVFTPRNQGGKAPWTVVKDVLFERNIVRNAPAIFSVLGFDNNGVSGQTTGIVIKNNLLLGSGGGFLALITNEAGAVTFDHNTYLQPQNGSGTLMGLYAEGTIATPAAPRVPTFAVEKLVVTNNILQFNFYGIHSSFGQGTAGLNAMAKAWTWSQNVLGGGSGTYPPTTTFVPLAAFAQLFSADFLLLPGSAFGAAGTDAADLGWAGQMSAPAAAALSLSLQVSAVLPKCRVSLSSDPPDALGGWVASVSSTASELRITWAKAGQASVEVSTGACK